MNPVNPKKLLHSKWTATEPRRREKHFIVTAVKTDASGAARGCTLEAVHSGNELSLDWRELKDPARWKIGWV